MNNCEKVSLSARSNLNHDHHSVGIDAVLKVLGSIILCDATSCHQIYVIFVERDQLANSNMCSSELHQLQYF
jgi:hypothetical protein